MTNILELDTPPSLPGLYARAALASMKPVHRVSGKIPDTQVVVREARVTAETLTAYHRMVGGTVTDHVDSVALHGLGFGAGLKLMAQRDFPLPLAGAIHLSNRARLHRPVRAGEPLRLVVGADDLKPHHAGATVELTARAYSEDTLVHTSTSVYLAKGVRIDGIPTPPRPQREAFRAPLPTGRYRLPGSTGRAWAEVLGDWNPIHLSALTARALGAKRPIAHGTYLAARALSGLTRADSPHEWDISFAAPVRLPAIVTTAHGPLTGADDGATWFRGWDARSAREHYRGSVR